MVSCLRFYNFSLPAAETAATRMSFSSYPGAITSRALGCSGQGLCGLHPVDFTAPFPFRKAQMIFTCSTVASCSARRAFLQTKIHRENLEFPCEGCEVNYAVSCKRRGIVAMETSLVVLDDNVWDKCSSQVFF